MNLESILDCQERGARARILGAHQDDNPYHPHQTSGARGDEHAVLSEAWNFGWLIEDSMRQFGTGVYISLRSQAALAAGKLINT